MCLDRVDGNVDNCIAAPPPYCRFFNYNCRTKQSQQHNEDFNSPSVLPETPFSLMSYYVQSLISPLSPYTVSKVFREPETFDNNMVPLIEATDGGFGGGANTNGHQNQEVF
jgi:hypothetical protein